MSEKQLSELVEKTNVAEPTEKDRQAFANYLSEHPNAWKRIGDVSHIVRERILQSIQNRVLIETTRHGLRDMKE